MGDWIDLSAADGHTFAAYEAGEGERGGLVICQEIFGVNKHIRSVVDRYADHGFRAISPCLFDRTERGVELEYNDDGMARGIELAMGVGWEDRIADIGASAEHVSSGLGVDEGGVGIVGYCFGGSLAWLSAAELPIGAAVGYYGGQIHMLKDRQPRCPVMLHFGDEDHAIPLEHVDEIRELHPEVTIFVYPAGHGFNCDIRDGYHAESSAQAEERTLAFLDEHLGTA